MKEFLKSKKGKVVLVLAAFVVLAGGGAAIALVLAGPGTVVPLTFGLGADDPTLAAALLPEMAEFNSLNRGIRASASPGSPAAADLLLVPAPPIDAGEARVGPIAWSGMLWTLAARRDILDALESKEPAAVAALRAGEAGLPEMRAVLEAAKAAGFSPITLGNSHGWPLMLWLQTLAVAGTGKDVPLPAATAAPYASLVPAIEELASWRKKGWFDVGAFGKGWAEGLRPLDEGKALFAIISQPQLGALSAKGRASLEYLPLPRASGAPAWTMGSAIYLYIPASAHRPAEAEILLRYLTSPGVTARLSAKASRLFFSWQGTSGAAPSIVDSWYDASNGADFRALSAFILSR